MIDKKIGIVAVTVLLVLVAVWYLASQGGQYGPSAGPVITASPTPTIEPTGIAPVSEGEGGANMETPDIVVGSPNENLDLGSLV